MARVPRAPEGEDAVQVIDKNFTSARAITALGELVLELEKRAAELDDEREAARDDLATLEDGVLRIKAALGLNGEMPEDLGGAIERAARALVAERDLLLSGIEKLRAELEPKAPAKKLRELLARAKSLRVRSR
jgi:hypothetical protein